MKFDAALWTREIADRLTLYTPFVPGEKDEWWKGLAGTFK
jgi:hypothetical protein